MVEPSAKSRRNRRSKRESRHDPTSEHEPERNAPRSAGSTRPGRGAGETFPASDPVNVIQPPPSKADHHVKREG